MSPRRGLLLRRGASPRAGIIAVALVAAAVLFTPRVTHCWTTNRPVSSFKTKSGSIVNGAPAHPVLWLESRGHHVEAALEGWEGPLRIVGQIGPDGTAIGDVVEPRFPAGAKTSVTFGLTPNSRTTWSELRIPDSMRRGDVYVGYKPGETEFTYKLSCQNQAFWIRPSADYLFRFASKLLEAPYWVAVIIGLLAGLILSLVEARLSLVAGLGALARGALPIRLAVTLTLPAITLLMAAVGEFGPRLWGLEVIRHLVLRGHYVLTLACLLLGQLLAAGVLAYRREDEPDGLLRRAPSLRFVIGLAVAIAVPLLLICERSDDRDKVLRSVLMVATWAVFYVAAPMVVWRVLPAFLRHRARLAGVAVWTFALGQVLVAKEVWIWFFNVFLGPEELTRIRGPALPLANHIAATMVLVTLLLAVAASVLSASARRRIG